MKRTSLILLAFTAFSLALANQYSSLSPVGVFALAEAEVESAGPSGLAGSHHTCTSDAVQSQRQTSATDGELRIAEAFVTPGEQFCVPVTLSMAADLSTLEAGISWQHSILAFNGLQGGLLSDAGAFTVDTSLLGIGMIIVEWEEDGLEGVPVAGGEPLFELCFEAIGPAGSSSSIHFNESLRPLTAIQAANEPLPLVPVNGACVIEGFPGGDNVDLRIESAVVDTGQVVCLEVTADGFNEVLSMQFSVRWDTVQLTYDTLLLGNSSLGLDLTQHFNSTGTQEGFVSVSWFPSDVQPVTLPDNSVLFTLCLKAGSAAESAAVRFSALPTAIELTDGEDFLPIRLNHGGLEVQVPEVWPGDTDENGIVNHFDLLNIGLGFGTSGPERPGATIIWVAQPAPAWQQATPASNVNYRHLDTNGDGIVDAADTLALISNWGEETPFAPPPFEEVARSEDAAIYIQPDTVVLGEPATFNIMLGEPDSEVAEVYGLAFSILYDTAAVTEGSAGTSFFNSWMGTAGTDLIGLSKDNYNEGRIDVALTRIDGLEVSGSGAIGQLHITIQDVIFFQRDDYDLPFSIEDVYLITSQEEVIALQGMSTTSLVEEGIVGTGQVRAGFRLQAFPNPVREHLYIQLQGANLHRALLMSADGRVVVTSTDGVLPVRQLPSGLYSLQVWTDKGQASQRIMITN